MSWNLTVKEDDKKRSTDYFNVSCSSPREGGKSSRHRDLDIEQTRLQRPQYGVGMLFMIPDIVIVFLAEPGRSFVVCCALLDRNSRFAMLFERSRTPE
jgi:hypothetical protein